MASRPTARYCRSVNRIRAPGDNVWITDSILANAFERYCYVSRLPRRMSSSMPGPLENRRRLGKRRMTGLYSSDFQPTLPPWMLEFQVDLSQWDWKAPTSARERREKMEAQRSRPLFGLLTRIRQSWYQWLHEGDDAENAIDLDHYEALDPATEISERFTEALREALRTGKTFSKLEAEISSIARDFERGLSLGSIAADNIPDMFSALSASLQQMKKQAPGLGIRKTCMMQRYFWEAVVGGLCTSKVQGFDRVAPAFTDRVLVELSKYLLRARKAPTLGTILAAVPESHIVELVNGVEAMVCSLVWDSGRVSPDICTDLVSALKAMSPEKKGHSELLGRLEASVCGSPKATEGWLTILSRLPLVGEEYFLDAIKRTGFLRSEWTREKQRQICMLLDQQWRSQGWSPGNTLSSVFNGDELQDSATSLAGYLWMFASVRAERPPNTQYVRAILRLGLQQEFIASFQEWSAGREAAGGMSVYALQALRSQDRGLANRVCELMVQHGNKIQPVKDVDWTDPTWSGLVEDMIFDAELHPEAPWQVFHAISQVDEESRRRKEDLARRFATWFSHTRHLPNRGTLRNINKANMWLIAEGKKPGALGILALARIAVRPLWQGEPGRPERLRHVLEIVQNDLGRRQAMRLAALIVTWRKQNMERA